jgi:hypothetical protein
MVMAAESSPAAKVLLNVRTTRSRAVICCFIFSSVGEDEVK